jgi:hypothetical protein
VKLEIINISLDFVADFWNFGKEKTGEGIVGEEMFKFSTVEQIEGMSQSATDVGIIRGRESSCARRTAEGGRPHMFIVLPTFSSAQIHYQELGFGHLFDGVAQAFATEAGVFDAAVGHVIDAERRNISRDHAADFEFFISLEK